MAISEQDRRTVSRRNFVAGGAALTVLAGLGMLGDGRRRIHNAHSRLGREYPHASDEMVRKADRDRDQAIQDAGLAELHHQTVPAVTQQQFDRADNTIRQYSDYQATLSKDGENTVGTREETIGGGALAFSLLVVVGSLARS